MLKKVSSFVLASLRGSTYRKGYAFASSLAAAALGDLFEHPGYVLWLDIYSKPGSYCRLSIDGANQFG
jgi:hypothetical protein